MISAWIWMGCITVQHHCSKEIDTQANERNESMRHASSQDGAAWNLCLVRQDFTWFALILSGCSCCSSNSWFCCKVGIWSDVWTNHVTAIFTFLQITWRHFKCILSVKTFSFFKCTCFWDMEDNQGPFQSNFKELWAGITWRNGRWVTGKQRLGETY